MWSPPLAPAFLRAVFDVLPVFGPFLASFKGQAATHADLGLEPVLCLGHWHGSTLVGAATIRIAAARMDIRLSEHYYLGNHKIVDKRFLFTKKQANP